MKRLVIISLPEQDQVRIASLERSKESPYQLVEEVRENWKQLPAGQTNPFGDTPLAKVIPIHNSAGIRDKGQIAQMNSAIQKGAHIFESGELPNIKLVVVPRGRLLAFDGHHSLLSYLDSGKRHLKEIPHLIICGENASPVTPAEISYFFPEETREKVNESWDKYTVNWQAEEGQQLEERKVFDFAQLTVELGKRDKSSVQE